MVDSTCQHKNREALLEGPEITVSPVGETADDIDPKAYGEGKK